MTLLAAGCTVTFGTSGQSRSPGRTPAPEATRSAVRPATTTPTARPSAPKAAPPSWATTYSRVSSGVVRIDDLCSDSGQHETGTGFLIAPNLVATVAHVVNGRGLLHVSSPVSGIATSAHVVGYSHDNDLALLRTDADLPGHVFRFAKSSPGIGSEMAAIGFPLAQAMQLTIGHITGSHDHRLVGAEYDLSDVLLSDAAMNPGNSGGPWLTIDGDVLALTESGPPYNDDNQPAQGNNGGVSAEGAAALFSKWRRSPHDVPHGCQSTDLTTQARQTLDLYFAAINSSDYGTAYAQLGSSVRSSIGLGSFTRGVQSSTDSAGDGSGAAYSVGDGGTSNGRPYLDIAFQSHQHAAQGPSGQTCTNWTLRYQFRRHNGLELINSASATPGTSGHQGCR
jgi:serine protease Do